MNALQSAIARVTGFDEVIEHQSQVIEHVENQNALLQRQIEDIDYLNLFDIGAVEEVIAGADRKKTLKRLRRLRHENPLAKQSIKLIIRFTLGRGVELVIGPDPAKKKELLPRQFEGGAPQDEKQNKVNGLFPGTKDVANGSRPPGLPRKRPQVSEAEQPLETFSSQPAEFDDSDPLKDQIDEFWNDIDNQRALTSRESMQDWVDDVATDGEKFFIGFTSNAAPYIKLVYCPLEEIDTILYHPDNRQKPVYYVRQYIEQEWDGKTKAYIPKNGGQPVTKYYLDWRLTEEEIGELGEHFKNIPSKEKAPDEQRMFHSLVNPLWTKKGRRGISELYASREWFRVYKEFMEDRAAINKAATAIAYQRKIKGGPTAVAQFGGKLGNLEVGYDNPQNVSEVSKLTRPVAGGIYDSNPAVDLEWMKADTGAVNAKEDARSILMAAGAGAGMFQHYFGDGGDANLATAQSMELPMVKTFEDWQQWVEDNLRNLCFWVITVATDVENAKKTIKRIAGSFPPIISQDVVKYMTAWSQLKQNVAPGNRIVAREAIKGALTVMEVPNVDQLMGEIEAEEESLELERQAREREMMDAMRTGGVIAPEDGKNGNGSGKLAARNGSSTALDPQLTATAKGKPPPDRNGGKPPR